MAHLTIQDQFMRIPPVTRTYTTACVLTTILVHLEVLSPFQLYYNPALIIYRGQIWRLFTTFLFFGSFGFNFLFNLIFTYRYCRMLEENHYHGKTAEFIYMFLFGGLLMAITGAFVQILFLGQAFTIMLVYIWARRNPLVRMNFFGLFNFQAPYLPWVLLGFSLLLGNSVAVDIMDADASLTGFCLLLENLLGAVTATMAYPGELEARAKSAPFYSTVPSELPELVPVMAKEVQQLDKLKLLMGEIFVVVACCFAISHCTSLTSIVSHNFHADKPGSLAKGIAVGHIYYYLEDVFPHQPGGFRILATPWLLKRVFDRQPSEAIYIPPEERPGGFQWGQDVPANNQPQDNNPPPQ